MLDAYVSSHRIAVRGSSRSSSVRTRRRVSGVRLEASAEDRSAVVLLELTASPRDLAPIRTGAGELLLRIDRISEGKMRESGIPSSLEKEELLETTT